MKRRAQTREAVPRSGEPDATRLSRILAQAEAHGGLRQMAFEWLERQAAAAQPRRGPPCPEGLSFGWEQLEFPWAHA